MKVVSRYCDSCGIKIPAGDITEGIALKYEESFYCKDCKAEIIPLIEQKKGKANGAVSTGAAKTSAPKSPIPDLAPPLRSAPKSAPAKPAAAGAAPPNGARPRPATGSAAVRPGAPAAKRPLSARPGAAKAPLARKAAAPARAAPDDDEVAPDEEEAEGAEGAAPRSRVMLFAVGGAAVVAVVVGVVLAMRGPGTASGGERAGGTPKAGAGAGAAESPSEKNRKLLADAEARIAGLDPVAAIKVLDEARSRLIPAPNANDVAATIDARVEKLGEEVEEIAAKTFKDVSEKAAGQRSSGDFEGALATLRGFPEELRETGWWRTNARAEIAKIELLLAAKREAEPILRKAESYARAKEWRLAIGVLEGYDREHYRDATEIAERVEKMIAEYLSAMSSAEQSQALARLDKEEAAAAEAERKAEEERRRKEDERIARLPWENLMGDDLFIWKLPEPFPKEAWKLDKATRELRGSSGEAIKGQEFGAAIGVGKSWRDVAIQFRYKVMKGGFRVGFRSKGVAGVCGQALVPNIADGQWHTVEVLVRGSGSQTEATVVEGGAKKKCETRGEDGSSEGGVAFLLEPNSEVVFADLKVKVID